MVSSTKSSKEIIAVKSKVEDILSDLMKAGIRVYPDDKRLISIYNKIKTPGRNIEEISEDEIKDNVIKYYVAGYINSTEVVEDVELH
jgi:hypothetical protein